jgi:hypothetical protein
MVQRIYNDNTHTTVVLTNLLKKLTKERLRKLSDSKVIRTGILLVVRPVRAHGVGDVRGAAVRLGHVEGNVCVSVPGAELRDGGGRRREGKQQRKSEQKHLYLESPLKQLTSAGWLVVGYTGEEEERRSVGSSYRKISVAREVKCVRN